MPDCPHPYLDKIDGPTHKSGKDYVCRSCGEQFRAELKIPTVEMGTNNISGQAGQTS